MHGNSVRFISFLIIYINMNILFICNQGMHRSRTAAELFKDKFSTRFKGIYNNHVTGSDLDWADKVIVMEEHQRSKIAELFPKQYLQKQILLMDIPDVYSYNQPELINLLKTKIKDLF